MYKRPLRKEYIPMRTVGQMVNDVLRALKFEPAKYAVFEAWDREAAQLVRGCEAIAIQGTKLSVKVPSAVHRQEIAFYKEKLIKNVNQAMGKRVLNDVRFELENN